MKDQRIEGMINGVNWSEYLGPEYYSPDELIELLVELNKYNTNNVKYGLDNKVLFALGNNHAGTYYPAILGAIDIIIKIESDSDIASAHKCANVILNNLCYFQAELGSYNKHSFEGIETFIKGKLKSYSDGMSI